MNKNIFKLVVLGTIILFSSCTSRERNYPFIVQSILYKDGKTIKQINTFNAVNVDQATRIAERTFWLKSDSVQIVDVYKMY
jgi:hypothetical protein